MFKWLVRFWHRIDGWMRCRIAPPSPPCVPSRKSPRSASLGWQICSVFVLTVHNIVTITFGRNLPYFERGARRK
jgi:hypothetical protein